MVNEISLYLDPVIVGDIRAGLEKIENCAQDSRIALGLPWLCSLVLSKEEDIFSGEIRELYIDGKYFGDWKIDINISGKIKIPFPAHKKQLQNDGLEILDILHRIDDNTIHLEQKIWKICSSLLIQASKERNENIYFFTTPLGRIISASVSSIPTKKPKIDNK